MGWGAALVGAGILFALDRFALVTVRPPKKKHARSIESLPFKSWRHPFNSLGQALQGWFAEPKEDRCRAVAVLVHGWGSSHGRMTLLAEPLLKAGYPCFLCDIRHHGESFDAPYVTVRHFRDDVRAAVREMREAYPGRPLVLMGHSMGGSAAVLAVAEGAPVDGLITVGAPADLWETWAAHFDRQGLPGRWVSRILKPFWRYRAGEPFHVLDPAARVGEVSIPFLLLHGEEDQSVPVHHAYLFAQEAGTEAVILEGEGHNDLLGKEPLHRSVLRFIAGVEGAPGGEPPEGA